MKIFWLIKHVYTWEVLLDKPDKRFKFDVVSGEIWLRAFLWFLLCCRIRLSSWVSPPFEFHTNHSVTNGHERPWRTAKARVFEMSNLCLQRGGRWSLQQLFIIQSAESGSCLQLSTSVYCWRLSQRDERLFEQQVVVQSRSWLYLHFSQLEFEVGLRQIFSDWFLIPSW